MGILRNFSRGGQNVNINTILRHDVCQVGHKKHWAEGGTMGDRKQAAYDLIHHRAVVPQPSLSFVDFGRYHSHLLAVGKEKSRAQLPTGVALGQK